METESHRLSRSTVRWIAVGGGGLVLVLAGLVVGLSSSDAASGASQPQAVRSMGEASRNRADLTAPLGAAPRMTESRAPEEGVSGVVVAEELDEPVEIEPPVDLARAWELVEELRVMSRDPKGFHARALPLALELSDVCVEDAGVSHVDELTLKVVNSTQESALVRGAVLLGIAGRMEIDAFHAVFDEWFDAGESPGELLRAAALAATRIGGLAPCSYPLGLSQLGSPKTLVPLDVPGVYPLRMTHLVGAYESGVLRNWLDASGDVADGYRKDSLEQASKEELEAFLNHMVTSETIFAVWGHRALLEPEIERAVIRKALPSAQEIEQQDVLHLRVAGFLVHALSLCSEPFRAAADDMANSPHSLLVALAESFEEVGPGAMAFAYIEELEALRYSSARSDRTRLRQTLLDSDERLREAKSMDPEEFQLLSEYFQGLSQDDTLKDLDRCLAARALISEGSWEDVLANARDILFANSPVDLAFMVIQSLIDGVVANPGRRPGALEVLETALGWESRSTVVEFIEYATARISS